MSQRRLIYHTIMFDYHTHMSWYISANWLKKILVSSLYILMLILWYLFAMNSRRQNIKLEDNIKEEESLTVHRQSLNPDW